MKLWSVLLLSAAFLCVGSTAFAQNLQMQVVDKDCWVEIYDDEKYDMSSPHIKLEGEQTLASLKNVAGRDWNNDIESLIVGPNANVRAYTKKDFEGTEIAFVPDQKVPDLAKLNVGNKIESMKVTCGKK
ncbi:MAG TPA: beta/gamma crystallin domain-containing protein [Nitrospirales bacterium]|nr:beta/gamma crystallin domain-containing protein [Nitrospirales bacterium]